MLITFVRKPGGQIDEQVGFSKKIRPIDNQTCNVILDYKEKKVLKCIIDGKKIDTDFDRMHDYYKQVYPNLIDQLIKLQETKK
jgi:non-homologous end joining protein Ku